MNREILFRGKRIDNGEWVEGSLVINTIETDGAIEKQCRIQNITYGAFPNDYMSGFDEVVISSTVGQFTEVFDKNKRKIFDGDIIRVRFESDCLAECEPECWSELFEVFFDNEHHAWFTKINGEIGEWLYEYDGECEVIGNIHDNELGGDT